MDKPVSVGIAGEIKSGRIYKFYISVMSEYFQVQQNLFQQMIFFNGLIEVKDFTGNTFDQLEVGKVIAA